MKRLMVFVAFLVLGLGGCQNHYYKVDGQELVLYLKQPEARKVQLRCSFDGFREHPARRIDDDTWVVEIPLQSEFAYFYLVDDQVFLPPCRFREADDFGSQNCIFVAGM